MKRLRGHLGHCLALIVVIRLAAGETRAGSLTLIVTASDGVSTTISAASR